MDPVSVNVPATFDVRNFTRSSDNWGYPKMGSPWIRPRSLFSKNFNGLCLDGHLNVLKSVGLPVHEIIAIGLLVWG